MCCGQKRSELKSNAAPQNATLKVRYSGQPPVYLRGSVTGSIYQFSPVQPVQSVDRRDAKFLLGRRLFRLSR
jgi:hypothetical protein